MIQKCFDKFCENIRLTDNQEEDAKTKYDGVCKTLHHYFYENKQYDGSTKFLFGSYRKKTNIRPLIEEQDVDVLFKMPVEQFEIYDNYNSNGQSALLQKIREILKDTYTTTNEIKGWGKVVLVKFKDRTHNIEVLPAWEEENGSFKIPNTEKNGGIWENFNPKKELEDFQNSNKKTNGFTAELSRMVKSWKRQIATLKIKSYEVENYVIDFLRSYDHKEKKYSLIIKNFFEYLKIMVLEENKSHIETALTRINNAIKFEEENKAREASEEWRKIFGKTFPVDCDDTENRKSTPILNPPKHWSC
jgi:hypothetical protein